MPEKPGVRKRPSASEKEVSPPPAKRRQQSHTTNKAVANFFTPSSKKEPEKMTWRIVKDSLLDSTLVVPASGKKFGRDASDWKWWHSSVPGKLKQLHEEGYLLAVISNQGGISLKSDPKTVKSDQKRLADFKGKVSAVVNQLDLPVTIYAATGRDEYRKPRVGMWRELLDDHDLDIMETVDLENSFFVGDAGGREAVAGITAKDHSCVDRNFAANVGIIFHTPEEYFLEQPVQPFVRGFDPTAYVNKVAESSTSANPVITKTDVLDIVLLVGSPGAGKSSFYWKHLQPLGYGRVNQDILKTREKCVKAAMALIEEGTSVVVDNTNADQDTNPENRTILPKLAFTSFASRFRAPKLEEGFKEIITVDFEFNGSDAQKELWRKYWI
ncbi:hypothetical protein E8E12_004444 [Didymella heteroderae]|uniref:Uncharacterized protein n=1 Tax=Didymella heteroderae TaxID=1769908 RepID=A0A9P4WJW9_9PLEO|nr:hypothetical protein E8E12_004444 [Didymella heteroderae]